MTAHLRRSARSVVERLEALDYGRVRLDEDRVIRALARRYQLLDLSMPSVMVVEDLPAANRLAAGLGDRSLAAAWKSDSAWMDVYLAACDAVRDSTERRLWDLAYQQAAAAARLDLWDAACDAGRDVSAPINATVYDAVLGAAASNVQSDDPRIGMWAHVAEQDLIMLDAGAGWFMPGIEKAVLVPRPRLISEGSGLHRTDGMAVEWANGVGFYFLRGVQFSEVLHRRVVHGDLQVREAEQIEDPDQRAVAISMLQSD